MIVNDPDSESTNEILDPDFFILKKAEEESFTQLDAGKYHYFASNGSCGLETTSNRLIISAEQNNMEAQFRLGDLFASRLGAEQNEATAYDWYLKSALQGYPKALTRIHDLYQTGKSLDCRGLIEKDSKEAEWAEADLKKDNIIKDLKENRVLQLECKTPKILEYFMELSATCLKQIKDNIDDKYDAYLKLGFLYQHGYGIRKNETEAIRLYTLAAENGNMDALYNLGCIYHHNPGMIQIYPIDFKKLNVIRKLYENRLYQQLKPELAKTKECITRHLMQQPPRIIFYNLPLLQSLISELAKIKEVITRILNSQRECTYGDFERMYKSGSLYNYWVEHYPKLELITIKEYITKFLENETQRQDEFDHFMRFRMELLSQRGTSESYEDTAQELKLELTKLNANITVFLEIYQKQVEYDNEDKQEPYLKLDNIRLDSLIHKIKEQKFNPQVDFETDYHLNPSDSLKMATICLILSAEQNNMEAQFRLGDLYASGQGVEQNETTAYNWYLKSALQGYPKALTRIHNLYQTEKSMYCRGQIDSEEAEWATSDFKKMNNIRELYEYRVKQRGPELTHIIDYFTSLLEKCREQVGDDSTEDKRDAYLKLGFLYQHGYGIRKIKTRAIEFYTLAAKDGSIDAAYNLGNTYHLSPEIKWNYREAFKWYTKAVENGHICAHNELAYFFIKGLGTDPDYSKAICLYTKAAENRHVNAMVSLATIFRVGKIVKQDHEKAAKWYMKAIAEGSTVAENSLELIFKDKYSFVSNHDLYPEKKIPEVFSKKGLCSRLRSDILALNESGNLEKLKKLAANAMKGDGHAMFEIGMKYYKGDGFAQDKNIAFRWIKNAAKSGLTKVQCIIAKMYKDGDCIDQDYHKASIWFKKAAKRGDKNAQYNLGYMYHNGLGVRKDPLEASKWYTFAADKSDTDAQCQLGILRVNGEGLLQDMEVAFKLFNTSVRQKDSQAIYRLGTMYEHGNGVRRNSELALNLFDKASVLGSLDAQLKLACLYDNDKAQYHDKKMVFKYYEMAAKQGHPEAKYKLAIMYLDGRGVSQDLIQAYYLFKESSDLGYDKSANIFNVPIDYSKSRDINYDRVMSMFMLVCKEKIDSLEYNLGSHYSNDVVFSHGGFSNRARANHSLRKQWYQISAENGVHEAQYRIAVLYEEENNLRKAVEYYEKACSNGNIDAMYKLACLHLDHNVSIQNFREAFSLFNEAADRGHKEAYKYLNTLNMDCQNGRLELVKKMFQISAESGNIISQYKLGILLLNNKSEEFNIQEAIKWLDMASKGGFIEASYRLSLFFEKSPDVKKDYQSIIEQYQTAADKGHEKAMFRLAQLYHHGEHVERDYSKAFEFYTLAAQQNHRSAQLATNVTSKSIWEDNRSQICTSLGNVHLSYESCFHMWEHVAENGNFDLQYKLGTINENKDGSGCIVKAAKWYSKAADGSHADALYRLGRLYEMGLGVDSDYSTAIQLYERASELNNTKALYRLGAIYHHREGTKPDPEKALYYYERSAKKGNNTAQFTIGQIYEEGILLPQNRLESVKRYAMSASHGNDDAGNWLITHYDEVFNVDRFYHRKLIILSQIAEKSDDTYYQNNSHIGSVNYELGYMYYHGHGTPVDYEKAWECFCKSFKFSGENRAKELLTIKYGNINASIKDSYLKKVKMFEAVVKVLSIEDIYELGSIYYHGVYSNLNGNLPDETQVVVQPDPKKAITYFKMIIKRDLPEVKDYYRYCSYYLGMTYFVDVKRIDDSLKAEYYLTNPCCVGFLEKQICLDYINGDKTDEAAIFEKVLEWHEITANSNHTKLLYNIGWMYDNGVGTKQNYTKALHYYGLAAKEEYAPAYVGLAIAYENGHGVDENRTISIDWYTKAAKQNHATACFNLGEIYFYGEGTEINYMLASQYYKIAADQGHSGAQYSLGYIYENGYGVEKNYNLAIEWYTRASNQNNFFASYSLGDIYYYGEGVKRDYTLAFHYYKKAADQGDSDAQNSLGMIYENGYGVEKNHLLAIEWYTKAADQKHVVANHNLGRIYYYGEGVDKNYRLAFKYYENAAKQGDSDAQNSLGMIFENGHGVKKNHILAIKWYTKAAKQSHVASNYNLGNMYYHGKDVIKDYTLAFHYYKAAADQGDRNAQNKLGVIYEHGYGVKKDNVAATEWYTKAVNQNLPVAIRNLNRITGSTL